MFELGSEEMALWASRIMPFAAVALGGLMISRIRYVDVLHFLFAERRPFRHLVLLIFAITAVVALWEHRGYLLLAGFGVYVFSGPVALAWASAGRRFLVMWCLVWVICASSAVGAEAVRQALPGACKDAAPVCEVGRFRTSLN